MTETITAKNKWNWSYYTQSQYNLIDDSLHNTYEGFSLLRAHSDTLKAVFVCEAESGLSMVLICKATHLSNDMFFKIIFILTASI